MLRLIYQDTNVYSLLKQTERSASNTERKGDVTFDLRLIYQDTNQDTNVYSLLKQTERSASNTERKGDVTFDLSGH